MTTWGQNDPVVGKAPSWGIDDPVVDQASSGILGFATRMMGKVQDVGASMYNAAMNPPTDPQYKDLPYVNQMGAPALGIDTPLDPQTNAAKMVAPGDQAYGEVLSKSLGNRFLGLSKDKNGYPIIEFVDKNGKAQKQYVNKPGLDFEDIDRTVAQVGAYLPAAGGATKAVGARAGLLKAGLAQTLAAGGTSLAQDAMASQMGSEQGIDFNRAMWSAAGAFGGEAVSRGLGQVAQIFKTRGLYKGGELTEQGKALAEAYGIDPVQLNQSFQKQFAQDMVRAEDPSAAARKVALESQGIHPTTGMVTQNNEDLLLEQDIMRKGILDTPSVKRSEKLTKAYETAQGEDFTKARQAMIENKIGVQPPDKQELGGTLQDSTMSKYRDMKQAETKAWDQVNPIVPDKLDLGILKTRIKDLEVDNPKLFQRIKNLDPQTQSNALAVRDQMDKLVKGKLKSKSSSLYGKGEQIDLDTFRRRLSDFRNKAFNETNGGSDYKAVTDQLDIFNEYLDDLATKANVEDAVQLMKARDLSKELRHAFSTHGDPAMDPGGRFIQNLIERRDTSPEAIVDQIFRNKDGLAAWRRLKEVFDPNASELKMMKAYAFEKNFFDSKGKMLSPEKAAQNVEIMRRSSLYNDMFSPMDQKMLDRFINQTRSLSVPNIVAGKGSQLAQQMARLRKDGLLRYFLQRRGQSATFQSKPLESFAWQSTARTRFAGPAVFIKELQGERMMKRILSATIPKKKAYVAPSGSAAIGATVGSNRGQE